MRQSSLTKLIREEIQNILIEQNQADSVQQKVDQFIARLSQIGAWDRFDDVKVKYDSRRPSGKYSLEFQIKGSIDDQVFEDTIAFLEKIGYDVDLGMSERYYDSQDDRIEYPSIVFDKKMDSIQFQGKPVDLSTLQVDGVDLDDHPKYTDAVAVKLNFADGIPLTDQQLEAFTDQNYNTIRDAAERSAMIR